MTYSEMIIQCLFLHCVDRNTAH